MGQPIGFDSQNCTDSLDSQIKNLSVSEPDQHLSVMETDQPTSQKASTASTTGPPRESQPYTSATLHPVDTLEVEMLDYEGKSGSEEVKMNALP